MPADKETLTLSRDMMTHLRVITHDRIETLNSFIIQAKGGLRSSNNAALLSKLSIDMERTKLLFAAMGNIEPPKTASDLKVR